MLILNKITKTIKKRKILNDINVNLPSTGIVLISGENGSGKTTFLNIVSMLDDSFEGTISFDGINLNDLNDFQKSKFRLENISYCFQKNNLVSFLNAGENQNIDCLVNNDFFINDNKRKISNLSQGQQQLIALSNLLKPGKKLYILDEVTACLDDENTEYVLETVKNLSKEALVIIVSHDLDLTDIVSQIITLEKGKIKEIKNISNIEDKKIERKLVKTKRRPLLNLFFKYLKNTKFISLGNFVINTLLTTLIFASLICITTKPKYALNEVYDNLTYLKTSVKGGFSDEELLEKFPINTSKFVKGSLVSEEGISFKNVEVIFNSHVDGEYIYINEQYFDQILKNKENFSIDNTTIEFSYNRYKYSYKLKVDDNIKHEGFYINEKFIKNPISYTPTASITNGYWDTEEYNSSYYNQFTLDLSPKKEVYGQSLYVNGKFASEYLGIDLNYNLEDDTVYIFDERLYTDKITYFAKEPYRTKDMNYSYNLNSKFKNGVKVVLLDIPNPSNNKHINYVIVSEKTFEKIISDEPTYTGVYISLDTNKQEIINFLSDNLIKIKIPDNYYVDLKELKLEQKINNKIDIFNQVIIENVNIMSGLWARISLYGLPIIYLMFQILIGSFIKLVNKNNDRILKKYGLNKIERYLLFDGFILINALVSVIAGLIFGTLATIPMETFGFIPGINLIEVLFIVGFIILTIISTYLCFIRSERV